MNLGKQKQLAARALKVSSKRIKFVAESADEKRNLKEMISRENARELLEEGIIKKFPKKGNSRTSANHILVQKKKGRQQGQGSRKGTANARFKSKDKWMIKIRALRSMLRNFKAQGRLESKDFRDLYMKSKGNFFRNKRHMMLFIEQNNLLKEQEEQKNEK